MTAKPVPEHISDERLAEVRRLASVEENDCLRDGARSAAQYHADVGSALTELQHRREAEAPFRALVVECRNQINSIIEDGAATDWRMWRDDLDKALAASPSSPASGVIDEIAAERRRQIGKGYDATHDDMHTEGEIARAAAVYAAGGGIFKVSSIQVPQQVWPYRWEYKPGDQRTNYVHAAAMLVAEIERLDRLSALGEHP